MALSCQVRVRFVSDGPPSDGGGARSDEAGPFWPRPRRTRGSDAAGVDVAATMLRVPANIH
eukprot:4710484-Prymnesium_polylepis.1